MKIYRAALIGCSRMGAFIDNEVDHDRPYSHAAGYEACDRTQLVALSDLREDVMAQAGRRYGVPTERQYTDFREMIQKEQPQIVSVATQPEQRADIVCFLAESGVQAIYAEKAMAASMADTDRMVKACRQRSVFFNLGTNRRWDPGFDAMKQVIDSGRIGKLRSLVIHQTGSLFNTASHSFDLLLRLNDDSPAVWVQAHLQNGDDAFDGDVLRKDPVGHGWIQFENGVVAYALNSGRGLEVEAVGDRGVVTALSNGAEWRVREVGRTDHRGRNVLIEGEFPAFVQASSTVRLIEDLVHALDTGERTRCGVEVARADSELIFAFIESDRRGGARVDLPLEESPYRLVRGSEPRQPRFDRI